MADSSLQNLPDPSPYGSKAGEPAASYEGGEQAGSRNTSRDRSGTAIPLGRTKGNQYPDGDGCITPYANESRTQATYEAAQADAMGNEALQECGGARYGTGSPQYAEGDGNIEPYANDTRTTA